MVRSSLQVYFVGQDAPEITPPALILHILKSIAGGGSGRIKGSSLEKPEDSYGS